MYADARAENDVVRAIKRRDALLKQQGGLKNSLRVVGLFDRRVPDSEQGIANELHKKTIGLINAGDRFLEIVVHELRQVGGVHAFGDFCEISDIREHNAQELLLGARLEKSAVTQELFGADGGKVAREALFKELVVEIKAKRLIDNGENESDEQLRGHRDQPRKPNPRVAERHV